MSGYDRGYGTACNGKYEKVHQHRYERRTGGKPWNRDRYLRFLLWNAGSSGSDDGVSREEGTWGVYEKIEKTLPN